MALRKRRLIEICTQGRSAGTHVAPRRVDLDLRAGGRLLVAGHRDAGICVFSAPRGLLPGGRFATSMDPQLVDEHWPVGVELVVAYTCGKHDQGPWVVDRHPRSLAHDLVVDARPERPGRTGIVGLEREGLGDLGVDPLVAELGCVDVARVAWEEGLAGQQRADEV